VLTLVNRARRRLFHNELFSQTAHAAVAILIALILLLLLGTGILDWRWMVLICAGAVVAALYRARKRLLSPYAAAQVVDGRMALADTISTAVYFQQESERNVSPSIRQFQLERANEVSESVDVHRAVPYAMPRGIYLVAVLLLVAGSLFALRYGLMGHLDLKPPLAHVLDQQLGWKVGAEIARNIKRPPQVPDQPDDAGASVSDPDQTQSTKPDASDTDASDPSNDSTAEKGDASKEDGKKDGNRTGKMSADGDQDAQAESNPSQSEEKTGEKNAKQDSKQSGGKPDNANSGENSSLMNKAKDLLQNLLSSLKPPSSNPGSQQQNEPNNQNKGQSKQNEKNGQPQNNGQKGDQSEGQQSEQAQDQADQTQQASGKNDSQQANKQPGSGAGNQDGDKRIKQAEDLAAMGKITEILGKRSANLTGEATVEVQATNQQLRTAYAPGAAQHGQSGGEIDRDEIPMAMQPYVQEYFKQARKQAAPPATPSSAKKQ
jgi:hypothetical protein